MRLIDAKSVLQGIEELKTSPFANPHEGEKKKLIQETLDIVACLCVKKEPTIDAVPVVRCKDCKSYDGELCLKFRGIYDAVFGMDYCSRGKRKESEDKTDAIN